MSLGWYRMNKRTGAHTVNGMGIVPLKINYIKLSKICTVMY
jgi:hypothetical protein